RDPGTRRGDRAQHSSRCESTGPRGARADGRRDRSVRYDMLKALADKDFEGKVLPFAPRDSAVVGTVQERAEKLRIALLPPLLMPLATKACVRASQRFAKVG